MGFAPNIIKFNQYSSPWTNELVILLREEWASGKSAAIIAGEFNKKFGTKFTNNSIIGKIDRLKLPHRQTKFAIRGVVTRRFRAPVAPPIDDAIIPIEQRKTLMQLKPDDCRWPVGEPRAPGFFFCGAPTQDGFSYCAAHYERSTWLRR